MALARGDAVRWNFTPGQRRLSVTLPAEFGGATHEVELTGGYTFQAMEALAAA